MIILNSLSFSDMDQCVIYYSLSVFVHKKGSRGKNICKFIFIQSCKKPVSNHVVPRYGFKHKKEEISSSACSLIKRLTADFFLSPYIRAVIIASISSGSGITRRAPFFLVIRDAAAFAKVSISVKSSAFKSSRPFSSTLCRMLPIKVSPAPVVSMVSGCKNGFTHTSISL